MPVNGPTFPVAARIVAWCGKRHCGAEAQQAEFGGASRGEITFPMNVSNDISEVSGYAAAGRRSSSSLRTAGSEAASPMAENRYTKR